MTFAINHSRISKIKPSATLEMSTKAKQMRAAGIDVKNLSAGEPSFITPTAIIEASYEALKSGLTKYTPSRGLPDLVKAIQHKFKRDQNTEYSSEEIIATVGTKGALSLLFDALLEEGDEVILFAPCWVSYADLIRLAGGTPVIVQSSFEDKWLPTASALKAALSSKTKAVLLCSPSNPTGMGFSKELLAQLMDVIAPTKAWIISDEIYEKLVYDDFKAISPIEVRPDMRERMVICNGLAKAYAMTGWRLGYAAGPAHLISAMILLQQQRLSCPATASQAASIYALYEPAELQADLKMMQDAFKAGRELVWKELSKIAGLKAHKPDGAFYYFIDASHYINKSYQETKIENDLQLCQLLLNEAHVATVPGTPFESPGCFRISFVGSEPELIEAFERLAAFFAECS